MLLRSGDLDTASQNWLLSALGKAGGAGSDAATAALTALLSDETLSDDLRISALVAAHQLDANVSPEMIQATVDILIGSGPDSPLTTTAALLLGDFAGQGRLADASTELLGAGLDLVREIAFERGEPGMYFAALGNSRRPDLVAESFGYLDHPDPAVRRAALEALGGLADDPRAFSELARAATGDDSSLVRSAALDSIVDLPPTPEAADLLHRVAGTDPDPTVRDRAVSALGAQALRGSSAARDSLVDLSADPGASGDLARSILADLDRPEA